MTAHEYSEALNDRLAAALDPKEIDQALIEMCVPSHLWIGLKSYLIDRRPPGGFLQRVLANDLKASVKSADPTSFRCLACIIDFLIAVAPSPSWGDPCAVWTWTTPSQRSELVTGQFDGGPE